MTTIVRRLGLTACLTAFLITPSLADDEHKETEHWLQRFSLRGYGVVNYYAFDWETDPQRRNAIDVERIVLYPSFRFTDNVRLNAEIEFEHGGTGVTMEFDRFEEFGEYETEVEKGGEVILEQLNIEYRPYESIGLRAGRIKVPVGIMQKEDEPREYFTPWRSEMEATILPSLWYENGIEVFGTVSGMLTYHVLAVNGLDGTGFSSANWIAGGHQTRFEMVNADDIAVAARIDVEPVDETVVGASVYYGNTTNNRPKPDLNADAHVMIAEGHIIAELDPLVVRAMVLYGTLENADLVSKANRNLSNNLNVKRTPVGSAALGWYAEAGYNVLPLFGVTSVAADVFARYEEYDTMAEVAGDIFDNPRWQRKTLTVGAVYRPMKALCVKAAYAMRTLGISPGADDSVPNNEKTFSLGFGAEF